MKLQSVRKTQLTNRQVGLYEPIGPQLQIEDSREKNGENHL